MNIKEALNHIINTSKDEKVCSRAKELLQKFESPHVSNTGFGDRVIIKVQKGENNDNS